MQNTKAPVIVNRRLCVHMKGFSVQPGRSLDAIEGGPVFFGKPFSPAVRRSSGACLARRALAHCHAHHSQQRKRKDQRQPQVA